MPRKSYSTAIDPILRGVREMLLPFYGNVSVLRQKDSSASNVVTELDIRIEEFLAERLRSIDSSAAFVGEEKGGDRTAEHFWLVDPIDGTSHFMRGMPFCTTMLALITNGEVVVGAIYDFIGDNLYMAERGKGATLNGRHIHVSNRSFAEAYVGLETRLDKEKNRQIFYSLRQKCILFETISSGFEHAMVASGKLEGRICFDPYGEDYDFAAGSLLVAEAGGIVANIGKRTYDYRNLDFIAANPVVFKELTEGSDAPFP